jgi:hypothetical protein
VPFGKDCTKEFTHIGLAGLEHAGDCHSGVASGSRDY